MTTETENTKAKWEAAAWASPTANQPIQVPFNVLAGEALDVARFCQKNWKGGGTDKAGALPGLVSAAGRGEFNEGISQEILEILDALQAAQTRYQLVADSSGAAPIERAHFLINEMRAACEWLFDETKDTAATAQLTKLDDAHAGDASQDALAAALFDYAELADQHADKIAGLGGFDVKLVSEARTIAQALREQSAGSTVTTTETALELRNRLASLIYDRMQRVRTAARFVFRGHPAMIRQVTSSYARRQRTAHRKNPVTPATPTPVTPTNGAPAPSPSTTVASH